MIELEHVALEADPDAGWYVKEEVVLVSFAKEEGELVSLEGPNRYCRGDAIITGATGSRWSVSRDRFDARYEPVPPCGTGLDGPYRNKPVPVLAKRMNKAFSIARSAGGDVLSGASGDWLMQYAPGDFGITKDARFRQVYRPAN